MWNILLSLVKECWNCESVSVKVLASMVGALIFESDCCWVCSTAIHTCSFFTNLKPVLFSPPQSLSSLVEKAEGFSEALSMQPTLGLCKLHQEICSGSEVKKADNIEVKDLLLQVEVTPPESGTSNSILLKKRRRSYSPQKHYPLRAGVINLDTWKLFCGGLLCSLPCPQISPHKLRLVRKSINSDVSWNPYHQTDLIWKLGPLI